MKIYMAGPLFSTAELAFNKELAGLLRTRGHEVFLPQEHEQRKDLPRAMAAYKKAVEISPQDPDYRRALASIPTGAPATR